jgi:hypothetical protein
MEKNETRKKGMGTVLLEWIVLSRRTDVLPGLWGCEIKAFMTTVIVSAYNNFLVTSRGVSIRGTKSRMRLIEQERPKSWR